MPEMPGPFPGRGLVGFIFYFQVGAGGKDEAGQFDIISFRGHMQQCLFPFAVKLVGLFGSFFRKKYMHKSNKKRKPPDIYQGASLI